MENFLNQLPPLVREVLVRGVLAILALLLAWVLRHLVIRILLTPFRHRIMKRPYGQAVMDVISEPLALLILALGVVIALAILRVDLASDTITQAIVNSLVYTAIGVGLYQAVQYINFNARWAKATGFAIDDRLTPFIKVTLRLIVLVLIGTIVLQEWGVNVGGIVAGLGVGTLGISLAAQDTIANLFGFVSIVADRPFVVGDQIQAADVEGTVEHVGLRSTVVRRVDQSRVMIPNSILNKQAIINWSRLNKRRFQLLVKVPLSTSETQVLNLLTQFRQMLQSHPKVDSDTAVVLFTEIAADGMVIELRGYIGHLAWVDFMREVELMNLAILKIMRAIGIASVKVEDASAAAQRQLNYTPQQSIISDENRQSN